MTLTLDKHLPLIVVAPVVFAITFAATLIYSKLEPNVEDVDSSYVINHVMQPGYVLVDVRSEEVYEGKSPMKGVPGGHIPGAISFPIADLQVAAASAALAKVGITKKNTIILYCNTGTLAGRFADALIRRFNFSASNLKNYRGSVRDWITRQGNRLVPEDHETGN